MKKTFIAVTALFAITFACKKESQTNTATTSETLFQKNQRLITASNWRADSIVLINNGIVVKNATDSCMADDVHTFAGTGFYFVKKGNISCFENEPAVDTLKWEQTTNGDSLKIKGIDLPYIMNYKLKSVTDSRFEISNKDGFTEEIIIYKKK